MASSERLAAALPDVQAARVAYYRGRFDDVLPFTLGLEEELMLVHAETGMLAPVVEDALAAVQGDERYTAELRATQIELVTPVCATVADARRELAAARRCLVERLPTGVRIAGAGTHPTALGDGPVTARPRYETIASECAWAVRQQPTCGLHVHVAVPGAERALAVYNALRSYLPEIAALATNSPFHAGEDKGLASVRAKLHDALPRSGVPPAFASWPELVSFVEWGRAGGHFADESFLWWDMRLHPLYGTIEVRAADAQTRIEDAAAIAALCQALAADLAQRHDAGERLPVHDSYRIAENRYRAVRDGTRGVVADLESGEREPTWYRIGRLLERLAPAAAELGCAAELEYGDELLAGTGAERQRAVAAKLGVDAVAPWLADEGEASAERDLAALAA